MIQLDDYRDLISLDVPFTPPALPPSMTDGAGDHDALIGVLNQYLREENSPLPMPGRNRIHTAREELYARLIARPPDPLPEWFQNKLDVLLQWELQQRDVMDASDMAGEVLAGNLALWQGDITQLRVDAIVNAANAQLLGCFVPFHLCIDNVIHTAAGPRLRADCALIMQAQGTPEPTGNAKITRAYNLPSRFVLHTVGPIYDGSPADYVANVASLTQRSELASCYVSCLNVAHEIPAIQSIAFCNISTGVFGFPKQAAAEIAVRTVQQWAADHPGRFGLLIFDVFDAGDHVIYQSILAG